MTKFRKLNIFERTWRSNDRLPRVVMFFSTLIKFFVDKVNHEKNRYKKNEKSIIFSFSDSLILWTGDKSKYGLGSRLTARDARRNETIVQCYLFSNHLIITTRASSGKLHLVKVCSTICSKFSIDFCLFY